MPEHALEICEQIAKRERLSRKEAERLLEAKALELYEKTKNIERKKAEVLALNDLLMNVMSSSPDGIITCSRDMKIKALNMTAERQLGVHSEHFLENDVSVIIPNLRDALSKQDSHDFRFDNLQVVRADGTRFPAEVRGTRDGKSEETYYVLFLHDISKELAVQKHIKVREHQIDEARRLEAIGALSAGIAHEINTPIQFIGDNLGFLREALGILHKSYTQYESLRERAGRIPELSALADEIAVFNASVRLEQTKADIYDCVTESVGGIEQVRDIVLLMKEFAHPGTGGREPANVNDIINGVVKISHNKHRNVAEVALNLDSNLPSVYCRRGQIQQVILNLVMNAVDAIEETGAGTGHIRIATEFDDDNIYIHISDTGPGVPQTLKEKIFDPFFTTKPVGKGTGQGLALAKDFIITSHEGQLGFIDVEGYRTTFAITLPRRKKDTEIQEINYAA